MEERICSECGTQVEGRYIRKRCRPCYRRMMRALQPKKPRVSRARHAGERVLARSVAGPDGCVIYTGTHDKHGYGEVYSGADRGGLPMKAYRATYEYMVGPVPASLELDHTCHTRDTSCQAGADCLHRRCVNPHHLEPVTKAENMRRARHPATLNSLKTHCKHGHEFTPENTINQVQSTAKGTPRRRCRACRDLWSKGRSIKAA